jgi:BioD-like phosphotransacetylase family protein
MEDFEILFHTKLLSGEQYHYKHFQSIRLVATSLETFNERIFPNQLIVTPATRVDIILALIEQRRYQDYEPQHGLILTGRHPPLPAIITKLKQAEIPSLYAAYTSFEAMRMITSFTAKIHKKDIFKVKKAIELVENNIDFSLII